MITGYRRKKKVKYPVANSFPYEQARDAMQAAIDIGRYDVAQEVANTTAVDLCAVCAAAFAVGASTVRTSAGKQVQVQTCSGCGGGP